ncbi:MAG: hypothetical protein ABIU11_01215, partial [Chitinophagaceae bacterium]
KKKNFYPRYEENATACSGNLKILSYFLFSLHAPVAKNIFYRHACQFRRFVAIGNIEHSCHADFDF